MNPTRQQLLAALAEFSELFPTFRLGQMICNLTSRVKPEESFANPAGTIWDIEDEELLATVQDWIAARRTPLQETGPAT